MTVQFNAWENFIIKSTVEEQCQDLRFNTVNDLTFVISSAHRTY